jgi:hypothetical protein
VVSVHSENQISLNRSSFATLCGIGNLGSAEMESNFFMPPFHLPPPASPHNMHVCQAWNPWVSPMFISHVDLKVGSIACCYSRPKSLQCLSISIGLKMEPTIHCLLLSWYPLWWLYMETTLPQICMRKREEREPVFYSLRASPAKRPARPPAAFFHPDGEKRHSRALGSSFSPEFGP